MELFQWSTGQTVNGYVALWIMPKTLNTSPPPATTSPRSSPPPRHSLQPGIADRPPHKAPPRQNHAIADDLRRVGIERAAGAVDVAATAIGNSIALTGF